MGIKRKREVLALPGKIFENLAIGLVIRKSFIPPMIVYLPVLLKVCEGRELQSTFFIQHWWARYDKNSNYL